MSKFNIVMRKRLIWSLVITLIIMGIFTPYFIYQYGQSHTIEEASNRNFLTLIIGLPFIFFLTTYVIISDFFNLHPDYTSLINAHKKENPDIPERYYEKNGNEK